ncbi:MAG TPA: TPM domain-containing protein [Opitutus sp.]|nr:TPM domain-containing protein [Opitutus sp.]
MFGLFITRATGAEVIPPAPKDHFNDYAGMVSPEVARQLNSELTQFERDTSNQIVVAIYRKMESDSSIEDYTVRVAQAWGVGQQDRKNGAVLFVFQADRAIYIQVGYGLEGVLPDIRAKQIIENEIIPRFRAGDFQGGVVEGTRAMLAAVRGEYQGTGQTVRDRQGQGGGMRGWMIIAIFLVIILQSIFGRRRGTVYSRRGRRGMWMFPGGGSSWGGGSWGGGSGRSGGGGSFSGGGGSFGGGGAGGRW